MFSLFDTIYASQYILLSMSLQQRRRPNSFVATGQLSDDVGSFPALLLLYEGMVFLLRWYIGA